MESICKYIKNTINTEFSRNEEFLNYLSVPYKSIVFSIPFKKGGKIQTLKAFRVQHNNDLGIFKGGFRLSPYVSLGEMLVLAFLMTLKSSLWELPFGGAKGGISIDPKEYTEEEIKQIVKEYVKKLNNDIGEDWDVMAPDLGTNETVMETIFNEYSQINKKFSPSITTGKPEYLYGLGFRKFSTGYGVAYATDIALKKVGLKNPRIFIQGFGNVGRYAAVKLYELGYKISGVSDSKGGIICENGIDINKLIKVKQEKGSVVFYEDCKKVSSEEFLTEPCDVLILAALENAINKENVNAIKAKLIVEGANFPIDLEIEDTLLKKNITIVPDILANGGGVYVSYFEWLKGKTSQNFENEDLEKSLKEKIETLLNKTCKDRNIRKNCYTLSLRKLYEIFIKKY